MRIVSDGTLWIFGYGSLVWRPAFPYLRVYSASIEGYVRRFWQGSTDHRGLPGRPGRVVTLLPERHESLVEEGPDRAAPCWGTAYKIPFEDPDQVLAGLDHRERGGYERVGIEIELRDRSRFGAEAEAGIDEPPQRVQGLVYIAGPENENYLGASSIHSIAKQIQIATGPSGTNPEYVFELADRLREMGAVDAHVFEVEQALRGLMVPSLPGSPQA